MSQPAKRNAEEAFSGQDPELQTKRRRRKSRKSTNTKENTTSDSGLATDDVTSTKPPGTILLNVVPSSNDDSLEQEAQPAPSAEAYPAGKENVKKQSAPLETFRADGTMMQIEELGGKDAQKSSKRSRRQKNNKALPPQSQDIELTSGGDPDRALARKLEAKHQKHSRSTDKTTWVLSSRKGGTFLNIDPIITEDNKYLILATKYDIHVYSAATSLLVRSINISERADIRTCLVSLANNQEIFVGLRNGSLFRFDWTTGRKLSHCKIKSGLAHLSSAGFDEDHEYFVAVVSQNDGTNELLQLSINLKTSGKAYNSLLNQDYIHSYVAISKDLSTIVIFGRDSVHLGQSKERDEESFIDKQYTWKSLVTKGRIVSCDARIVEHTAKSQVVHNVEVAIGLQNGAIIVYNDMVDLLGKKTHTDHSGINTGRRLHWHRTAVRAVKWSRDGNYLVSGGDESVLVIWQLDTNQKQFLPHLSTMILNITISKSGAHYALRLADNSVMVLSTADLSPSTNIAGLSLLADGTYDNITMHPRETNQLLSAVSVRAIGSKATSDATHLQVYDVDASLQIARQALTRNFISAVNVAPNGQPLHEPNVTHLCVTNDGKWLATVDEWSPNEADIEALRLKEDRKSGILESILRIWCWQKDDNSWIPSVRIEKPHEGKGVSVLAMAAHPSRAEFATIAQDGRIKVWTPKTRTRNGVTIKDSSGTALYNWSCSFTSQIESCEYQEADKGVPGGALAYSQDGSVLAAYWASKSITNYIHLIDSSTGNPVLSQPNLVSGKLGQLQFCGRYLAVLSNNFTIFDTITSQTTFSLVLKSEYGGDNGKESKFLAVIPLTNDVAVGVNIVEQQKPKCRLGVFNLGSTEITSKTELTLSGHLRALIPDSAARGFVVVDTDAGIRRLTSQRSIVVSGQDMISHDSMALTELNKQKGIEDIFGTRSENLGVNRQSQTLLLEDQQTSSQTLDDLLNVNKGHAQLDVDDLFERVAKAVSGVHIAV